MPKLYLVPASGAGIVGLQLMRYGSTSDDL